MSLRIFGNMNVSASGLRGMRAKMNVISENIANAQTTQTAEGGPYRRKNVIMREAEPTDPVPVSRPVRPGEFQSLLHTHRAHMDLPLGGQEVDLPRGSELEVVEAEDSQPFKLIYNPGHPDADEQGYVLMPNIDVVREFVDLIAAQRAYDANVSAIDTSKKMFSRALEI
jgi:flagellar basal-body rod protein FlgC